MNKAILLVFLFGLVLTDGETPGTCVIEWTSSTVALSTKSKEFIEQGKALGQDTNIFLDGFYLQNIKLGSNCNGVSSFAIGVTLVYEDANTDDSFTKNAGCSIIKIPQGNGQLIDSMICTFFLADDENYNRIEIPASQTANSESATDIQVKGNQQLTISLTNTNENENSMIRYNLILLMILLVLF